MRVLTRVTGAALPPLLALVLAGWGSATWQPTPAGGSGPAESDPAVTQVAEGNGGAVLGPAVAYLREPDGTVRRIR